MAFEKPIVLSDKKNDLLLTYNLYLWTEYVQNVEKAMIKV